MVVIVVAASFMVLAWSTGLLGGLLVTPKPPNEAINLESTTYNNSTSVTLGLRNSGSASLSLITYYVKDTVNSQYARTVWAGPSINPGALGPANFNIGASCPTCTQATDNFVFTTGNSYTVIVVTARNSQFTFTIQK